EVRADHAQTRPDRRHVGLDLAKGDRGRERRRGPRQRLDLDAGPERLAHGRVHLRERLAVERQGARPECQHPRPGARGGRADLREGVADELGNSRNAGVRGWAPVASARPVRSRIDLRRNAMAESRAPLQTEFNFTLPKGYVDSKGVLHREGRMRLATALDEIV